MPASAEDRVRLIEDLVNRLEAIEDREHREIAKSLMEAVLELHGMGLDRMMELTFDSGESGKALIRKFGKDDLVSSLLLLHGLHPDDLETRVNHALAKSHGNAELLGVFEGVVRVRLTGDGCGLRTAIEAAVREAAPDATGLVIEEVPHATNFVPLETLYADAPRIA